MAKTEEDVAALKLSIEQLFAKHGLRSFDWRDGEEPTAKEREQGAETVHCKLSFDADVYEIFSPTGYGNNKPERWSNARRREFDRIVARHRFWYDFEDYTLVVFMEKIRTSQNRSVKV